MPLDPQKCVDFVEYFANHLANHLEIQDYKRFFNMRTEEMDEFFEGDWVRWNWGQVIDQLFELELMEDAMKPNFGLMIENTFGELPVITWPEAKDEEPKEEGNEDEPAG